jgi:hypothetical protein
MELQRHGGLTDDGDPYGQDRGLYSLPAAARNHYKRRGDWETFHNIVCAFTDSHGHHVYARTEQGCDCAWDGGTGDPWGYIPECLCPFCNLIRRTELVVSLATPDPEIVVAVISGNSGPASSRIQRVGLLNPDLQEELMRRLQTALTQVLSEYGPVITITDVEP